MSAIREGLSPPPSSQSHFAQYENFTPDADAPFHDEFARLASSQNWPLGSQQYTQERTIALREELRFHYFPRSQTLDNNDDKLTKVDNLKGYQDLCHEVGIQPHSSIARCRKLLQRTLVNIVDLIDARRTSKMVKVWQDFEAFRKYTLQREHRINMDEAKKDGGHLASLLQHLRRPRRQKNGARRTGGSGSGVLSGRVAKKTP